MTRIQRLHQLGQSAWLDHLDHGLIASGELRRLIERDGLRGITSNPTIFQKAIAGSSDYDLLIRSAPPSDGDAAVLQRIMVQELTLACDALRPVYDASRGTDGFASIEVDPTLAQDTGAQIEQALALSRAVARPNLMVKIPATRAGIPAIESCLSHGININVTLLFSVDRYREVADAHLRALERRVAAGQSVERIASVASFFVSRIDKKVDPLLDERNVPSLRGRIAIANAKVAYEHYEHLVASDRFRALASRGARPQRLLWGSTSPKDPAYGDTYYIDALVGPATIDTMTPDCFHAYLDHGSLEPALTRGYDEAHGELDELAKLGIDMCEITDRLEVEGVEAFNESFRRSLAAIAGKRRRPEVRHAAHRS